MSNFWERFKAALLSILKSLFSKETLKRVIKDRLFKAIIVKIVGRSTGIKAWLIGLILKELYEEIAEPIFNSIVNELGYRYDKTQGRIKYKKLRDATNEQDRNDAYDDILS